MRHTRQIRPIRPLRLLAAGALALAALAPGAWAQRTSPVYLDDAPSAEEALARASELAALGNLDEASRVLHDVVVRHADQVAPTRADPDLFLSIRTLANRLMLAQPALLERYAALHEDMAAALIETGAPEEVERTMLLTPSGFEAALRVAQGLLEDARFDAAWRALVQLEGHPARTGARARDAAGMLGRLAAYRWAGLDAGQRERSLARLTRWRADAGLPAPGGVRPAEAPDLPGSFWPLDRGAAVDLSGVLGKPLASARMGDAPESIRAMANEGASRAMPESARVLHAMPTLSGDLVFTNDSESVCAFDRFTLGRRWKTTIVGPPSNAPHATRQSGLEDPSAVDVAPPHVAALMGLSLQGRSTQERTLAVLDSETGEIRWTVRLSESDDPRLQGGLLRGPAVIEEGLVLVSVVRSVARHRLLGVSVAAFDVRTGSLAWLRPVSSIGHVAWAMSPEVTDPPLVSGGVVYRADRLGTIAAIEAASGRPIWIRRAARTLDERRGGSEPWEGNRPLLVGDRLVALTPDRSQILVLDPETGVLLDSFNASRFGEPSYLLELDGQVVAVGLTQIASRRLDGLSDAGNETHLVGTFPRHIRGRVAVMGDELVVPLAQELRVYPASSVSPSDEPAEPRRLALERPGIVAATDGQLVVADDLRVHSYLSWDTAERLLRERIEADPLDPGPAVTYAELAYRAGREGAILRAVDTAMRAMEADPLGDRSRESRGRMFVAVLEMVEPSASSGPGPVEPALRETLLDRLGRLASTPGEQVAFLLVSGRVFETTGRPALAVERYQEVLASETLSGAIHVERTMRLPAETEATRRLRSLIRLEGRGVYEAYEQEAGRLLAELGDLASAADYERIARRYPVSTRAPVAWQRAARERFAGGQTQQGIFALEEGITSAADTRGEGDPLLGQIAGALITRLIEDGRLAPAAYRLETLLEDRPGLALWSGGEPLATDALRERIATLLAERERRPRIGGATADSRVIVEWTIETPRDVSNRDRPTDAVVMRSTDGRRALWRLGPGGALERAWSAPIEGELLRIDHHALYVTDAAREQPSMRWVARHDLDTGEVVWRTPFFAELFSEDGGFDPMGPAPRVDTPLERARPLSDLFVLFDALAMVMVERTGRAASFDLETGRLLWAHEVGPAPVQPVHDAAAGSGVVAMGGLRLLPPEAREADGEAFHHVVVALDAQTGELLFEHKEDEAIRWVRVSPEGPVLVATGESVVSLDVFRRFVRWRNRDEAMRDTFGAWVFPGRAVLRDVNDSLYLIDTDSGRAGAALRLGERLNPGFQFARVVPLETRTALATAHGVALWDRRGELIGLDERRQVGQVLAPEFAEGFAVTLGVAGMPIDEDSQGFDLNICDLTSLKAASEPIAIELGVRPQALALVDGKILVSAGGATVVIDAPVE
jgi:outer membrane protein assembly factor BamB/tetratricopeptide (TPR) repeat protein